MDKPKSGRLRSLGRLHLGLCCAASEGANASFGSASAESPASRIEPESQPFLGSRAIIGNFGQPSSGGFNHASRRFVLRFRRCAFFRMHCCSPKQTSPNETATCNFDADKQLAAEYQHFSVNLKKPLVRARDSRRQSLGPRRKADHPVHQHAGRNRRGKSRGWRLHHVPDSDHQAVDVNHLEEHRHHREI